MKTKPLLVVIDGLDGRDISAHQLTAGENLSRHIMDISPDRFNQKSVTIYRDCMAIEKLIPIDTVPYITIQPDDFFVLRATPASGSIMPVLTAAALGAAVYFTGGGIAAALLIGGVALTSGALAGLIASPQLPSGETSRDQASGLNTIGTPHNMARLRSRVPEIFGLMRIWPDLAIPPIEVWSGRNQKVICLYCIGVGYYQISNFKLNETFIANLPGVAVTQYGPNETMPDLIVARESDTQQQIELDATGTSGGDFSAWITAVGDRLTELWIEIGFPSGLVVYKSSGGKRNEHTAITVEWQRMDGIFSVHSTIFSFSAATGNPLRYTIKIPTPARGVYRCRAKRNDDGTHGDDDVHVSNLALIKVIGIEELPANSAQTYRNTFVKLVIDNNDQVAQLSALTFNLMVKRMLHLVLPQGEVSPHFSTTSYMRDAIYYCLHDPTLGNFNSSDIDLIGLYDLHIRLKSVGSTTGGEQDDNTSNAEFNGIFDRWSSVDEMVQTIAQVGRAAAVYDGGRMIFMRDEDKLAPVSIFNRRVRPAEDESTRNLSLLTPDQEDGISIDWKDSDNGYVDRTYVYPEGAVNPKTIDLLGATHWEQVWRRAQYEWNRMALRRRTARITVTEEGLIVNPLDVVTVVDPWLDPVTDGDILDYDPTTRIVTIDQQIVPSPGTVMRIRSIEGDITDDIEFIVGTGETDKIRLLRDPLFTIVPRDFKHQVGNLYIIGTIGYMEQHDWHVIEVTARDRRQVELSLVEYAPEVFLCDNLPVPNPPILQ